ncbi:MAG: 3-oxoacyl-ACP reductase family protein [Acidobacteriota bacterium]
MEKRRLLEGKRVLVTGASRGLGRTLCQTFSREGASIALNYANDTDAANETVAAIEANGGRVCAFRVSVLDAAGLAKMVKQLEQEWGGIDILVNNAGISQPLPIALMEEEDWDAVMDVNIKGQFLATRAVLRGMIRRKSGCILNIGSLAGIRLIEAPIHYCASKAAVKGFTEALSKEVARYNIRVNCLAPGLLDEGVAQNLPEYRVKEFLKHVSLHRKGTMQEVADFATFLISDRNSYMNGATIVIDGGL